MTKLFRYLVSVKDNGDIIAGVYVLQGRPGMTEQVKHTGWRHWLHHAKYVAGLWLLTNMVPWPIEHYVWENAPLLRNITEAMGL